ncbi:MAG TPA: hypothetical protein VFV50_14840 [Bdellovibrionales bacterium]|nr:hypothetical protein [Bdellovibrionales bacterium]
MRLLLVIFFGLQISSTAFAGSFACDAKNLAAVKAGNEKALVRTAEKYLTLQDTAASIEALLAKVPKPVNRLDLSPEAMTVAYQKALMAVLTELQALNPCVEELTRRHEAAQKK